MRRAGTIAQAHGHIHELLDTELLDNSAGNITPASATAPSSSNTTTARSSP